MSVLSKELLYFQYSEKNKFDLITFYYLFDRVSACPLVKKRKPDGETGSEPANKRRIKEVKSRENSPAAKEINSKKKTSAAQVSYTGCKYKKAF